MGNECCKAQIIDNKFLNSCEDFNNVISELNISFYNLKKVISIEIEKSTNDSQSKIKILKLFLKDKVKLDTEVEDIIYRSYFFLIDTNQDKLSDILSFLLSKSEAYYFSKNLLENEKYLLKNCENYTNPDISFEIDNLEINNFHYGIEFEIKPIPTILISLFHLTIEMKKKEKSIIILEMIELIGLEQEIKNFKKFLFFYLRNCIFSKSLLLLKELKKRMMKDVLNSLVDSKLIEDGINFVNHYLKVEKDIVEQFYFAFIENTKKFLNFTEKDTTELMNKRINKVMIDEFLEHFNFLFCINDITEFIWRFNNISNYIELEDKN